MTNHRFLAITLLSGGLCFVAGLAVAKYSADAADRAGEERSDPGAAGEERRSHRLTALPTAGGAGKSATGQVMALSGSAEFGMYERMCGYFRIVSKADPSEIPGLMMRLQREVSEEMGGDLLVRALGARWAEQDPVGAYEALLAGNPAGLEASLEQILGAVAKTDPRAAWQTMLEMDVNSRGLFANTRLRDRFIGQLIGAIAVEDAGLATELTAALENPEPYLNAIAASLRVFAEGDPQGFLERLDQYQFASRDVRATSIEIAFERLAEGDLESALGRLEGLGGDARKHAELGLARAWSYSDPVAALTWANGLQGATQRQAQSGIIRQLAEKDPAAAAHEVESLESPSLRQEMASDIADAWARKDRDAAVAWVRDELEGKAREQSYAELLRDNVQGANFDEDFELLKEMADGSSEMGWGHYRFAQEWAKKDPQAAAEWSLARPSGREEVLAQVTDQWVLTDPEAVARFAGSIEDEELRKDIENRLSNYRESQQGEEVQP